MAFGLTAVVVAHDATVELQRMYEQQCNFPSDINEHIPVLKDLAAECSSVMELGIRGVVSTWGVLQGLSESSAITRLYLGIDLDCPPADKLALAKYLAHAHSIAFRFWQVNVMAMKIEDVDPVDMLFIDTLHIYCHLTYELELLASKVGKYIVIHDTTVYEYRDDPWYTGWCLGNYSEYPAEYDRTKKGLWPAIQDFLVKHPEWSVYKRLYNNNGLTILKRVGG